MATITIPKKEYQNLIERQSRVEKELILLRGIVQAEVREGRIRPVVLKRWERISRDLDRGQGRSFPSFKEMKAWLRKP